MNQDFDVSGLQIARSTDPGKTIPPPPRKLLTRLVLPLSILITALILLGYATRDSIYPAIDVHTVRVVSKSLTRTPGTVTIQAPGWVEADPFPYICSSSGCMRGKRSTGLGG